MAKGLLIDPAVLKRLRELPKQEKATCMLALCELIEVFGQPHKHSGIGIRKVGKHMFECRAGLALRFLFQVQPAYLYVSFVGNHDEVKASIRSGKYD